MIGKHQENYREDIQLWSNMCSEDDNHRKEYF